jgi:prolyl-tRNA synthetase
MKEDPSDAEVDSHKLMMRAGLIRKVSSGAYSYLPLGTRVLNKVISIVRKEMDKAGAIEVFLPALTPIELLEESGRLKAFGEDLIRFKDRHGRYVALGPTHEEIITTLVQNEISSYRQLPITLYQIQTKFRDEARPRFGVLRSREFLMKDAYSFDADAEGLNKSYQAMYDAYCRIFERCGLNYVPVEADSGAMGGDVSHEFMVPSPVGEDVLAQCPGCGYSANIQRAVPAPIPTIENKVINQLTEVATPDMKTIEEVSKFLNIEPEGMVKTLIYATSDKPVAVLIRGDHEVNETKLAKVMGQNHVTLADESIVTSITDAPLGFAGPSGLKVKIIADQAVSVMSNFVTGGNKKDTHLLNVNPGRDFRIDQVADLRYPIKGDGCPKCSTGLVISQGIEIGHVFKLGTRYSDAFKAKFLTRLGEEKSIIMGCYGIGINRIIAALIETTHDSSGIIWPKDIAPYHVLVIPVNTKDTAIMQAAEKAYDALKEANVETLLDDRDMRAGVKFKDADLIGIPLKLIIGKRFQETGEVEIKLRKTGETHLTAAENTVTEVKRLLETNLSQQPTHVRP